MITSSKGFSLVTEARIEETKSEAEQEGWMGSRSLGELHHRDYGEAESGEELRL